MTIKLNYFIQRLAENHTDDEIIDKIKIVFGIWISNEDLQNLKKLE